MILQITKQFQCSGHQHFTRVRTEQKKYLSLFGLWKQDTWDGISTSLVHNPLPYEPRVRTGTPVGKRTPCEHQWSVGGWEVRSESVISSALSRLTSQTFLFTPLSRSVRGERRFTSTTGGYVFQGRTKEIRFTKPWVRGWNTHLRVDPGRENHSSIS